MHLIRDTQLTAIVPSKDKVGDPVSIDLDGRALRAQFIRQGADVMLRIEHRPPPQPPARPTPVPLASRSSTPTPGADVATPRDATPRRGNNTTGRNPTTRAHGNSVAATHTQSRTQTPPEGSASAVTATGPIAGVDRKSVG